MSEKFTELNLFSTITVLNRVTSASKLKMRFFTILSLLFLSCAFNFTTSAQTITFETPTYTLGNINGQDGWSKTGPFDSAVSSTSVSGFGSQALRISNAITSGSFGDQTFSKSIANEAGETSAVNGGLSGGTRQKVFVSQFQIASAVPGAQQPGLSMSTSADRGDGARMSYLAFQDLPDGIHVFFSEYIDAAPFGTTIGVNDPLGCGVGDDFTFDDIATLSRNAPHTIKTVITFVDGERNDIVQIYIDGVLVKTGTSWEDYFRFCEGQPPRTVDSQLFRTSGTAVPANNGNGFLFDNLTMFLPSTLIVDDNLSCMGSSFTTIQSAIDAAMPGDNIQVCAGNYTEDVNVNKANITLQGAGVDVSTITGPHLSGGGDTVLITAGGVTIDGFTITRTGNNVADWAANTQNQGINVAASSGVTIQNSKITGNRNGIYVGQSSNNTTIRRNIIESNRTGVHIVDNNASLVEENFIENNWTMGVLYRTEGGAPALIHTVRNNRIAGNWYSEIENRDTPGTAVFNASGNYLGTLTPNRVTTTSGEPSYVSQIPVAYGGSSVPPPTHPTIAGPQSARIDYSPFLNSLTDTQPAIPGFQGDFTNVTVNADSPQANGTPGNIQEGIDLALSGGSVTVYNGTYAGNVDINKAVTLKGTPTISGTLTTSVAGAVISPGFSPGIINSGSLSLNSASSVNIEIAGTTPGTGHDQLNVTGTVALGGATLNVSTSYSATIGNSFVIVNNDGGDAVSGTFNGLAEGATFNLSGSTFQISYVGGTGNDVVLTVVTVTCNNISIPTGQTVATNTQFLVPINIDNTTGRNILGYSFTLTYNPAVVTPIALETAGTLSNGWSTSTNNAPGSLNVVVFNPPAGTPLTGMGVLLNVRFVSTGAIGTSSTLGLSNFLLNEGVPCVVTTNGNVTIISGTISGTVTYANATSPLPIPRPVPNTTLTATGLTPPAPVSTDANGLYSMSGFSTGAYTITPSKTGQVNGISNADATAVAQHIVGFITLNSTQLLAADVTQNGTVTSLDATYIAQTAALTPNPSSAGTWRFVPSNRSYPNVQGNQTNQDYSAILLGEVTGNWNNLLARPGQTSEETEKPVPTEELGAAVSVNAPANQFVNQSSAFDLNLAVSDTTGQGIFGYEFNLIYNPSVILPQVIPCDGAGTVSAGRSIVCNPVSPGFLRVVVFSTSGTPMSGPGTLLKLKFNAIGVAGNTSPLTIQNFMFNEGVPQDTTTDGQVRIVAPTSAQVSLGGQIFSATGQAVPGEVIMLTRSNGETVSTRSSSFGYYQFEGLTASETYTISVNSKRHTFTPQTINLTESITSFNLFAIP